MIREESAAGTEIGCRPGTSGELVGERLRNSASLGEHEGEDVFGAGLVEDGGTVGDDRVASQ